MYKEGLTYFFQGGFEKDNINDLITFIESTDEHVNIMMHSYGGEQSCLDVLLFATNGRKNISIFPIAECSSSALLFLLNTKHPVYFIDNTLVCVAHLPHIEGRVTTNMQVMGVNSYKKVSKNCKYTEQLLSLDLTKRQLKSLRKGEDVELFVEDLKRLTSK